jgi:histidinol phosphatase-like PHP family hydrolase
MTWTPLDCHAHSTMSDGELAAAELAEVVRARGVRPSVSDHISRDVAGAVSSPEQVVAYLDALAPLEVMRGGEFCWQDVLWRELGPDVMQRFTHRLGSLHAIFLGDGTLVYAFSRHWPDALTPAAYMDAHLANLERLALEMPVEILAHPTLLPYALRGVAAEELWTEALEERLALALAGAGIVFEVSARYRPHERLVRCVVSHGVRLSLGSDGHTARQVGDIESALALTRAIGVADADLYDPAVHGRR